MFLSGPLLTAEECESGEDGQSLHLVLLVVVGCCQPNHHPDRGQGRQQATLNILQTGFNKY